MSYPVPLPSPSLILASASPRRRELLTTAGVAFVCQPADVDETPAAGESPEATVSRLAEAKAVVISVRSPQALVLGADTMVFCGEHALGKPRDLADARAMLRLLSGQAHVVLTGVALLRQNPLHRDVWVASTRVVFKTLTPAIIDAYMAQVHVLDKAGAYAIQECGELIVDHIEGRLSNVIGLPIEEVLTHLPTLAPR